MADTRDGRGPTDATYWRLATLGYLKPSEHCDYFAIHGRPVAYDSSQVACPFRMVQVGVSFSCFRLSLFLFLFSSFFFLLFLLSLLVFSLLSLFCSPIFFEQAVVTTTRTENRTEKIIDNSGWVWLTGQPGFTQNGAEPGFSLHRTLPRCR